MIICKRISVLNQVFKTSSQKLLQTAARHVSQDAIESIPQPTSTPTTSQPYIDWNREMEVIRASESRSVIAPIADVDSVNAFPLVRPSHNLGAYVKHSEVLQTLIHLGVDLNQIERRKGLAKFVANLDLATIQPHLRFLRDIVLPADALGQFLTKNPLFFKESLDDLTTRISYLQSKLFQPSDIERIVQKNPYWLMFSTQRIDGRLGFFQTTFALSGAQVRQVVLAQPKLITYRLEAVRKNSFVIQEELGFSKSETKSLLLAAPKLWMMNQDTLTARFEYLHKAMGIAHDRLVHSPSILYCREHRLRERHEYLKVLGKAQYDPTRDLFVSLQQIAEGTDQEFALNVAKTAYTEYESFLRTM